MASKGEENTEPLADPKESRAVRPDLSHDHRDVKASNISSSTAGASSGDFHIYRHARERELMRLQQLKDEKDKKVKDDEFVRQRAMRRMREEKKTETRARKRRRKKQRAKEHKMIQEPLGTLNVKKKDAVSEKDMLKGSPLDPETKE